MENIRDTTSQKNKNEPHEPNAVGTHAQPVDMVLVTKALNYLRNRQKERVGDMATSTFALMRKYKEDYHVEISSRALIVMFQGKLRDPKKADKLALNIANILLPEKPEDRDPLLAAFLPDNTKFSSASQLEDFAKKLREHRQGKKPGCHSTDTNPISR